MPLNLPASRRDVADRIRADIRNELPTSTPTLRASWLSTLATGLGLRLFPAYQLVKTALDMAFPQTARDEFLTMFGELKSTTQNDALFAKGTVEFFGTSGSLVPSATELTTSDGAKLTTSANGTIASTSVSVTSLSVVGTTATVITAVNHQLTTGITPITITGATPAGVNVSGAVPTVVSDTSFTYTVPPGNAGTATGTIVLTTTRALIAASMSDAGAAGNAATGAVLTITGTLSGINSQAYVATPGFAGGASAESESSYRSRVILAWQTAPGSFSPAQISNLVLGITGNTRVFVRRAEPVAGDVTVLFVRDEASPTIAPTSGQIAEARAAVEAILPAHMATTALHVAAPTLTSVNVTLTGLSPDSASMRTAIENNLRASFRARKTTGGSLTVQELTGIISNSFDSPGNRLLSFTMTVPTATTSFAADAIPVLGTVSYV